MYLLKLIFINSLIWSVWSFVVGFLFHKARYSIFSNERSWVNTRTSVRIQKYFLIRSWKDKVPEAGSFFKGGKSKKTLQGKDIQSIEAFVIETRRAEYVHYLIVLITPIFFLFNPIFLSLIMVVYAIFGNIPCILIQRYNRSRCLKVLGDLS